MDLTGLNILVADDEIGFRELISDELSLAGASVSTASSGGEARALFEKNQFDAVISDIKMPFADGLIFLNYVRARDPKIPFIVLTGFCDASTEELAAMGATGVFAKPCDMDQVIAKICEARKK